MTRPATGGRGTGGQATGGRRLVVVDPGPLTTVQDRGRPGLAHLGVPRSGALDRAAAALANRLVGNPADAAVLETTGGGLRLRVEAAVTLAVTGAPAPVRVDGSPRGCGEAVTVPAGATVVVGPASGGLRSYLAVAGGVDVPRVLGSRSTDLLSGLGPAVLSAGDVLPLGMPAAAPSGAGPVPPAPPVRPLLLRLWPGPRLDWFTADVLATLTGATYRVSPDSNRIGLRLTGPGLARARADELPSEGLVAGAVQVPASGQPLVFLNDHPTTGGYPVVGVVDPADLDGCAQLRPGEEVRFRLV